MALNDEQVMLKDAARSWVRERAPVSAVRQVRTTHAPAGHDPGLYRDMADLGWTGILVPEDLGGFAFGYRSMGVVIEELGRTLAISPLVSSAVVAASAIVLGGSDVQKAQWLPGIAAGTTIGTLAIEELPRHAPEQTMLKAAPADGGWTLSGTKRAVVDGVAATLFIVVARTAGERGDRAGLTLFLCPADAAGVTRTPLRQIDSRGDAHVDFQDVRLDQGAVLGAVGEGFGLLDRILDRGRAALAAEMLGAAQQAFETTVDYLKTRVQFGQPIGSFQALQHRAADMVGQIELTRSAVEAALDAIDADDDEVPSLASLAKMMAGKTLRAVAREMVQMHGGIGMTDEHDAGLYLKRAQAADVTFGNAAFHRERYANLAGF